LIEGAVIVASILLAFGIDAWWEDRQMNAQRVELLRALESDFIETRDRVAAETAVATDLRDRAEAFMAAAGDRLSLDPDSIRFLSEAIVSGVGFFAPSVVSYDAARTSGEISLIESGALLEAFADFDRTLIGYERMGDNLVSSFYLGPMNDLRGEVVTLSVLNWIGGRREAPERFEPDDLNDLVQLPAVYAAAEPTYVLRVNMVTALDLLADATDRILAEIRVLLELAADAA
jgi:hypothetical protein